MSQSRIFILNGHPAESSLSRHLSELYAQEAERAGYEVRIRHLNDLEFDSDFGFAGYKQTKPLEKDLVAVVEDLKWSEHFVLAAPMWWGGLPAKLKGLTDRAFLPGDFFDTRNLKNGVPTPMLGGRTARVILTGDTPGWFLSFVYRNAIWVMLKKQILEFVGFKPAKLTYLAGASDAQPDKVAQWEKQIRSIAHAGS